mmetsp:Transcript_11621/g.38207  ORF Transcript_11621/g.38207 Transcript_11621/m.38207 type:complete len:491 (+) Transcript_11621:859-2331(+)
MKDMESVLEGSLAMRRSLLTSCAFVMCVLGNVALFAFANRSTGTWVRVWLRLRHDEDEYTPYEANIFTLGTFSTIDDFWRSGAKSTAVLTGIAAGALPYVVLLAVLVLWFLPTSFFGGASTTNRRSLCSAVLLHVVRAEHMLTMAAVLLCVALKTDIPLGDLVDVKLRTIFGWGTFAFEIATLVSYAIVLWLKVEASYEEEDLTTTGGNTNKSVMAQQHNRRFPVLAKVLAVANVAACVCGLVIPAIRFTVREIAEELVQSKRREFSILHIAEALNGSTRRKESKGFWDAWLATFCLGLPLLASLCLVVLFFLGGKKKTKTPPRWLFVMALHCHALASADVLFVVMADFAENVAVISDWIVNEQAKHVCDAIHDATKYDGCMKVTGLPLSGFWCLATYTVLNNALFLYLYLVLFQDSLWPSLQAFIRKTHSNASLDDDLNDDDLDDENLLRRELEDPLFLLPDDDDQGDHRVALTSSSTRSSPRAADDDP